MAYVKNISFTIELIEFVSIGWLLALILKEQIEIGSLMVISNKLCLQPFVVRYTSSFRKFLRFVAKRGLSTNKQTFFPWGIEQFGMAAEEKDTRELPQIAVCWFLYLDGNVTQAWRYCHSSWNLAHSGF